MKTRNITVIAGCLAMGLVASSCTLSIFKPSIGLEKYLPAVNLIEPDSAQLVAARGNTFATDWAFGGEGPNHYLDRMYNPQTPESIPWSVGWLDAYIDEVNSCVADDCTPYWVWDEVTPIDGIASPPYLGSVVVGWDETGNPLWSDRIPATHELRFGIAERAEKIADFARSDQYELVLIYSALEGDTTDPDGYLKNGTKINYGIMDKTRGLIFFAKVSAELSTTGPNTGSTWGVLLRLTVGSDADFTYKALSGGNGFGLPDPAFAASGIIGGGNRNNPFSMRVRGYGDRAAVTYDEWHVIDPDFHDVTGWGSDEGSGGLPDDITTETHWDHAYDSLAVFIDGSRMLSSDLLPTRLLEPW